jgi:hypothetical protein
MCTSLSPRRREISSSSSRPKLKKACIGPKLARFLQSALLLPELVRMVEIESKAARVATPTPEAAAIGRAAGGRMPNLPRQDHPRPRRLRWLQLARPAQRNESRDPPGYRMFRFFAMTYRDPGSTHGSSNGHDDRGQSIVNTATKPDASRTLILKRFMWEQDLAARLVELGAPASIEALGELAKARFYASSERDPIVAAQATWSEWPTQS